MDRRILTTFIIILTLGALLRLVLLSKSPPSLNWDEVALGYNAYSLSQTAKDEFGAFLPVALRSFDDYKGSLYSFLSIPFIHTFGLNEYGVRLLSSCSGITIIILIYFITYRLFRSWSIALTASALISIEPWAIHFSRSAFEANLALAFYLASLLLFLLSKTKPKLLFPTFILLTLSAYTYHAQKVLFPPTLALFCYHQRAQLFKNRKTAIKIAALITILLSPLVLYHLTHRQALNRLTSTSILTTYRRQSPISFTEEVFARYLSYFSPANLFVRGSPEPTQQINGFGPFYHLEFFFWIIGFIFLIKHLRKYSLFAALILISPLPAVITWNWFYPARVLALFALFSIITALGIHTAHSFLKKAFPEIRHFFWFGICLLSILLFLNSVVAIFCYTPFTSRGAWQFGMKEIVTAISEVEPNYDKIIFETRTAQPHIFVLFYSRYPSKKYQREIVSLAQDPRPRQNFNFGKFEFRDVYWFRQDENAQHTLLVGPESSLPENKINQSPNVNYFKIVTDPQGNPLAHLVGLQ